LGIEVAQSKERVVISQRKYALEILKETSMIDCNQCIVIWIQNQKLMTEQGEAFSYTKSYKTLVEKLTYLTITRPDMSFAVGVVSQFKHNLVLIIGMLSSIFSDILKSLQDKNYFMKIKKIHKSLDIVILIGLVLLWVDALLQDIEFSLKEILFLGKTRNKMLPVETKYREMVSLTCKLIWVKQFLQELNFL